MPAPDAVAARILGGQADAGVLYPTDVQARAPQLRAIEIAQHAALLATCYACVVSATPARLAARRAQAAREGRATTWLDALFAAAAQAILRDAGFMAF